VKTEFGFDVLEVAKGRYAPDAYRDFIGFEVAQPLSAFHETYAIELSIVLEHESKAIESYRHDVSTIIPEATRVAWRLKQNRIEQDLPGVTRSQFLYNLSRASYETNWGADYRRPGVGDKVLAVLFRLIPKVGPLKVAASRTPTPEAEQLFEASFKATLDRYRSQLAELSSGKVALPNDNLDLGTDAPSGQYFLTDETYGELLHKIPKQQFSGVTPALRSNVEDFYASYATRQVKRKSCEWSRTQRELAQLRSSPVGSRKRQCFWVMISTYPENRARSSLIERPRQRRNHPRHLMVCADAATKMPSGLRRQKKENPAIATTMDTWRSFIRALQQH
jgi:hypothetical protein